MQGNAMPHVVTSVLIADLDRDQTEVFFVIRSSLLVALALLSMNSGGLVAVEPPAKDRVIAKEPVYDTKDPKYCQLVFGPEAKHAVWLVIDGDHLFVDH